MKMKKLLALLMALAMVLSMAACGKKEKEEASPEEPEQAEPAEFPVELRGTVIQEQPSGVVSLSPALTVLLQEMGLEDSLRGISAYCDYSGVPVCGTPQDPDIDAIAATGASLVVTGVAPAEEVITELQQKNIDMVVLPRAGSLKELEELYTDLGRCVAGDITGRSYGEDLWEDFDSRLADLADRGSDYIDVTGETPTVIFLRIQDFVMATGDTFENELLEEMGFENLAADYGDWAFPEDKKAELTPRLIISDESITIPVLEKNAVYKGTQAVIKDQVVTVDMDRFERQTPDLLDELERVADFLFDGVTEARSAEES